MLALLGGKMNWEVWRAAFYCSAFFGWQLHAHIWKVDDQGRE